MTKAEEWIKPDEYAEDCEYFDLPSGGVWKGRRDMHRMVDEMDGTQGDTTYSRIIENLTSPECDISWWEWYGHYIADMGEIEAIGKEFKVQGVTMRIKDAEGKVVTQVDSWDLLGQLSQIGAVPSWHELLMGKTVADRTEPAAE